MAQLPAVSLAAVPGRRQRTIEVAQEIERRGFPGVFGPSLGDSLSLCNAIAMSTTDIEIGTSISPIYTRNVSDFAQTAGFLHEISNGRFKFGVGVSHAPAMDRLGIKQGKPLADMRQFVEDIKAVPRVGEVMTHLGFQERRIGTSCVFVVPNPSPANAKYSLGDLAEWYGRLREAAQR